MFFSKIPIKKNDFKFSTPDSFGVKTYLWYFFSVTTNTVLALFGAVYLIYMPVVMGMNPKTLRSMKIVIFNVQINVLLVIFLVTMLCKWLHILLLIQLNSLFFVIIIVYNLGFSIYGILTGYGWWYSWDDCGKTAASFLFDWMTWYIIKINFNF